jgi:hypothetical protein
MRLLKTEATLIICFALISACPISQAASTQPATTQATALPAKYAETFLKGLEQFLALEHRNRQEADLVLRETSKSISDEPLTSAVALKGHRLSDLSEEEANLERKELASAWSAIINFYTGFIDYSKIKVLSFPALATPNSPPALIQVLFPAANPVFPRPVNILIILIQEKNTWKVKLITLLPAQTKPGQISKSGS